MSVRKMLSRQNLPFIFAVYGIFCYLVLIGQIDCAYRVNAKERAKRYVPNTEMAPLERRHLHTDHMAIRDLLGLTKNEHMEISEHMKTAQGSEVWRLHEKYMGVPVFDVSLTVSTDGTGHLNGDATGEFIQGIEDDIPSVKSRLTESDALDIALQMMGDEQFQDEISSINCQLEVYMDDSQKARLVYKLDYLLENDEKIERPTFIIDANTGEVLLNWNNLDTAARIIEGIGGNEKVGPIYYDKGSRRSYLTQIGGTCFLENDYVKVINMENLRRKNNTDPLNFPCDEDFYDEVNGAFSPAFDAYYGANVVSKMFREWYGMSPLDKQILFRVHFGVRFENAFWDGKCCTFGDGEDMFFPMTSLDIAAHELGHGVTERFSGLMYFGESGSMNEAFSDMTGESAEAFDHGNDWLIGAEVMKHQDSLRYFDDPKADNLSMSHVDNFTADTDPHHGSGIYNHVFYIIVKEEKVPIKEAYRVFLMANQIYWHQRTTFASGACDVMKVAYDLGKDVSIFSKAFERVGIEVCDVSKHMIGLKNNRTLTGIRVEPKVHPKFSFSYPTWSVNITIHADSDCGKVHIKLMDVNSTVIAEGTTNVIIEIPTTDQKIIIELCPDESKTLSNVQLTATSFCNDEFEPQGIMEYMMWMEYCKRNPDYDYYGK